MRDVNSGEYWISGFVNCAVESFRGRDAKRETRPAAGIGDVTQPPLVPGTLASPSLPFPWSRVGRMHLSSLELLAYRPDRALARESSLRRLPRRPPRMMVHSTREATERQPTPIIPAALTYTA